MRFGALLAALALIVVAVAIAPRSRGRGPSGIVTPIPSPGLAAGSTVPASEPEPASPGASSPYTFDDEFDGAGLSPVWQRHFSCCGRLAGLDPSLVTTSGGVLALGAANRAGGWYGSLIDTKGSWSQLYGYFAARIKVPAGAGLWPAFWGYASGGGPPAEIDTMEVCPTASGATALHTSVHWSDQGSDGHQTNVPDLSLAYHVFAVDWRADHLTFYLDGSPVWTFSDAGPIPHRALPLILDLGANGDFCGPTDASTPGSASMLVDWVRVGP